MLTADHDICNELLPQRVQHGTCCERFHGKQHSLLKLSDSRKVLFKECTESDLKVSQDSTPSGVHFVYG